MNTHRDPVAITTRRPPKGSPDGIPTIFHGWDEPVLHHLDGANGCVDRSFEVIQVHRGLATALLKGAAVTCPHCLPGVTTFDTPRSTEVDPMPPPPMLEPQRITYKCHECGHQTEKDLARCPKCKSDKTSRLYWINGVAHYSVTSILDLLEQKNFGFAIRAHKKRNPDYPWDTYCSDSRLLGTYLHYRIGCELAEDRGLPAPEFEPHALIPDRTYMAKDKEYYNRRVGFETDLSFWQDFKRIANPVVVGTGLERFLYHPSGYAGRVDLVIKLDPDRMKDEMAGFRSHFNFLPSAGSVRPEDVWVVDIKSSRMIYDETPAQIWAYFKAWNKMYPRQKANRMAVLRLNYETGWEFTEVQGGRELWDRAMAAAGENGIVPGQAMVTQ